ncbi:MAG: 6-pyruvoyl-tetrahydropterin synthase-related protein [Anaerolineae bacterium]|nr:6-pyruvoyl-tetrahydropterin synthase-related protein [Anaerolineae bacterium]
MFKPGLPNTADGLLHFFRSALWRWSWDEGVLWPRWHTLLYYGYGYPLFNFYAPFLYITTSTFNLILPDLLTAFKAVLFLSSLNYSLAMYLWAKDIVGREGAIVASAAYTFATYRFRELYFQGNYAQFLAWSLYPWVLFFFRRLWEEPRRLNFTGAVFSLTALLLCHNISAMLFGPVLVLYLTCVVFVGGDSFRFYKNRLPALVGALLLAGAGGAIFWLPALVEQHFTQVYVLTRGFFDVAQHFLRLQELFAPSPPLDYRATNPPMPFNFGRFHLLLAGIGTLAVFRKGLNAFQRWHLAFAMAGTLFSSFMMLPPSLPLWRHLPFIAFTEYPSRMYGIAFIFSSLLAGASVLWVRDLPLLRLPAVIVATVGLIISVFSYQFPRPFLPLKATPQEFVSYEQANNEPGTTSASEYLSVWTVKVPEAPAIEPGLLRKALVKGEAEILEVKSNFMKFKVDLHEPMVLEVAQFYFPGWQGWLDGTEIPLKPCPESGLICLEAPPGEHIIALAFRDTPVRKFGKFISLLGLLLTFAVNLWLKGKRGQKRQETDGARKESSILALVVAGILILKVWWIEPHTFWFRLQSPPGKALPAQNSVNLRLGDKVALIGYDLESKVVRQGGELHVRLYWQALKFLDKDYSSFVHLIGTDGRLYAQSDSMHPAYIPTSTWNPSLYVVDEHYVRIPPDTPPVAFSVKVGLYERETMQGLGTIELSEWVNVQPRHPVKIPIKYLQLFPDEGIKLLGYHLTKGDYLLTLTLYWQANRKVSRDFQVFVHLVDHQNKIIAQADGPPVRGLYPTSRWLPGQVIEDVRRIPVSPGVSPELVLVGLYELDTLRRLPAFKEDGSRWENDSIQIDVRRGLE